MLGKLIAFVNNGQAVAAVVGLIDAVFGLLVVTGTIAHAPNAGLVASIIASTFTAAGIVLAFIQHSQHTAKIAFQNNAALMALQYHFESGGANPLGGKVADATKATNGTAVN